MTNSGPEPVASGMPYLVVDVAGRPPSRLEEFVAADTNFTIDKGHAPYRVRGSGVEDGDGVRFYEKDFERDGKDVRVWQVGREEEGRFVAAAVGAF